MLDKSPQRDQESLLLGEFEAGLCNTLTRLSEAVVNGVNTDGDLRCPRS